MEALPCGVCNGNKRGPGYGHSDRLTADPVGVTAAHDLFSPLHIMMK